jgi:hypothetical protein
MNSMTDRRAFSRSEKNDRGRAVRRRQILRLGVTLALTLATVASAQTYTDLLQCLLVFDQFPARLRFKTQFCSANKSVLFP